MKYLCLVYAEEHKLEAVPDRDCVAYDAALRDGGSCIASEALQPVATATTVRVRDGKLSITDGPFAETKEQLTSFYSSKPPTSTPPSGWRPASRRRASAASRCGRSARSARRSPASSSWAPGDPSRNLQGGWSPPSPP